MGDNKRSVSIIADTNTSSGAFMSKKRKTSVAVSGSCELELCSSGFPLRNTLFPEGFHDMMLSPATSASSAGTVVSGENFPGQSLSCCSSNLKTSPAVVDGTTTPLPPPSDLEAKGFETVDSTCSDIKLFRDMYLSSESSGDSEETMMLPVKSPLTVLSKERNIPADNMPPKEEIEEFFAMAEKYEQERFAEKYNYDIAEDMPLEGRYQWVRLN